jgi:hypothetical protein
VELPVVNFVPAMPDAAQQSRPAANFLQFQALFLVLTPGALMPIL